MNQNTSRRGALKLIVVCTVVTALVIGPAAVWANHQFNDVPANHAFHNEISAIADAGITSGFLDGGFHPSANVTRQAMAAFMERGLGRVGTNSTKSFMSPVAISGTSNELTAVVVEAGAQGGSAVGFAHFIGTAYFTSSAPAQCPCHMELRLVERSTTNVLATTKFDVPGTANEFGSSIASATVQVVLPVAGDARVGVTLEAALFDTSTSITGTGTLTGSYVPFGPDGDDTQTYCSTLEDEPNNTLAQAAPGGFFIDGCLEPGGDVDWFSVSVGTGFGVSARVLGLAGEGTCDVDSYLRLYNFNGTILVAQDNDSGPGPCSTITTGAVSSGTYYVQLTSFNGSSTGPYLLHATSTTP